MNLRAAALVLMCVSLSNCVRILTWPPLNCSQQGLRCMVKTSNCLDIGWLNVNMYTPSRPEELKTSVETREDEAGHLQPVLVANWKIHDDGSISYLKATELHVLVTSTNQNLCVRYSFKDGLQKMRNPSGEKWSFSTNMLVLDPGQTYVVSVSNIPKPEEGHSNYDVRTNVTVPDCQDPTMRRTQFCIERGSLWQPNISLSRIRAADGRCALAVSFIPDRLCEEYLVIASCYRTQLVARAHKTNQTTLNATFSLQKWPRSCCLFDAEIKPLFPQCGQDCPRRRTTLDICPEPYSRRDAQDVPLYTSVVLGVVFVCVMPVVLYFICRRPGKPGRPNPHRGDEKTWQQQQQQQLKETPKVLVIYSQDHHLYRDIVLKLCAFLQTKCGIKVVVDLLDATSIGMVGRLRWLEWQRQQLNNPLDKILVLCSRGVQAKWRAMCGQGQVMLREDVLSPTDDMLTPFLNLFLPDMHQAGMLGKYIVAYVDDISNEQVVPSVFDITVKYKLMKHFEELLFRILDIEKYQAGQVAYIEGISGDEYFTCASGRDLRNAIETFQVYQLENPDWFERECVEAEEEVITEAQSLIEQLQIPPVLECVPVINEGPPVCFHGLEVNVNDKSVLVFSPEIKTEQQLPSVAELLPVVNSEYKHQYPSNVFEVLTNHRYPHSHDPESVLIAEPVVNKPQTPRQNWISIKEEPFRRIPTEDSEDASLRPGSQPSLLSNSDHRSSGLQNSLLSNPPGTSCSSILSEYYSISEMNSSQPVELEEYEVLEPAGKGQSSDQGYISKVSSHHEPLYKEDPLVALSRLQEELFQRNVSFYGIDLEGN